MYEKGSMKPPIILYRAFGVGLVLLPIVASLVFPEYIRLASLVSQIGVWVVIFTTPFLYPRLRYAFFLPFMFSLGWGIWMALYVDVLTETDMPWIAYLISPFINGGISCLVYGLRAWVQRRL